MHQGRGVNHLHHRAQLDGGSRRCRRPASLAESSSRAGRSRFPPLDCRYWPMAVTASTDATDSGVIFFSTWSRSSWIRSKISCAREGLPQLA